MTLACCDSRSSSNWFLSFCYTTQLDSSHLEYETRAYGVLVNNINMLIVLRSTELRTGRIAAATSSTRRRTPEGHYRQRKKGQFFERIINVERRFQLECCVATSDAYISFIHAPKVFQKKSSSYLTCTAKQSRNHIYQQTLEYKTSSVLGRPLLGTGPPRYVHTGS